MVDLNKRIQSKASAAWRVRSKRVRQHFARATGRTGPEQAVFVAGAQRSGTNMVMDMLERSDQTDVYHERNKKAFERYELRDRDVLRQLIRRSPAPTVVFKALCECQEIKQLLADFSPARGVWVFRQHEDVVSSHIRKWREMPDAIATIAADDAATAGWRGRGMSEHTRATVRRCYHEGLSNASACALFWYFRNVLYLEQALDQNPRAMLISYDRLVANPGAGARDLFEFLELEFTPSVHDFVSSDVAAGRSAQLDIDPPIRELCEDLEARLLQAAQRHDPIRG